MSPVVWIMSMDPIPGTEKFSVLAGGYLEEWTIEYIKRFVAGGGVIERKP